MGITCTVCTHAPPYRVHVRTRQGHHFRNNSTTTKTHDVQHARRTYNTYRTIKCVAPYTLKLIFFRFCSISHSIHAGKKNVIYMQIQHTATGVTNDMRQNATTSTEALASSKKTERQGVILKEACETEILEDDVFVGDTITELDNDYDIICGICLCGSGAYL